MVCMMLIITYILWMMMMITLQDKEVLATVEVLQRPSPDKPLVDQFYVEFHEIIL